MRCRVPVASERRDFEFELLDSRPEGVPRVVEDGRDELVAYHQERPRLTSHPRWPDDYRIG